MAGASSSSRQAMAVASSSRLGMAEASSSSRPAMAGPSLSEDTGVWLAAQTNNPTYRRYNFGVTAKDLVGNVDANLVSTPHRSGLVYSAAMTLHAPPDVAAKHPECPERITHVFEKLKNAGCLTRLRRIVPRAALRSEIELFHESGMFDGLERSADFSRSVLAVHSAQLELSSSLYLNEHTALCARISCGSVIEMCDAVAARRIRNGFALVRPPGHHAEASRAMGFCLYNNVVIATKFIQAKYSKGRDRVDKVLILDWDVHHGNGTQQAFYDTNETLYMSLHRHGKGFYPGGSGGGADQVGLGLGRGSNVNVPWPSAGMKDGDYLHAFQRLIMPIATEFAPDFVIISAGFDAADGDEIGGMHLSPKAYAHMTQMLSALANGRLVAVLEGGYNLDALANSALAVTKVLLGDAPEPYETAELSYSLTAQQTVLEVTKIQKRFWKSLAFAELESRANDDAPLSRASITEAIRQHRANRLWEKYKMLHLPLMSNLSKYFQHAVFASTNLLDAKPRTVLFFVHNLADLRAEKPVLKVDPHKEYKAICDVTEGVLSWAKKLDVGVFDVNLLPAMSVTQTQAQSLKESEAKVAAASGSTSHRAQAGPSSAALTSGGGATGVGPATSGPGANTRMLSSTEHQIRAVNELITFIWDNHIELSHPKTKVIVLGYGIRAGHALMNLFTERDVQVRTRVKACSMVIGGPGTSAVTTLPLSAWVGDAAAEAALSSASGAGPGGGATTGTGHSVHVRQPRDARLPSWAGQELPLVPTSHADLRKWYKKNSKIVTAYDHPYWVWDIKDAVGRKAGTVERDDHFATIEVMLSAWPQIATFFEVKAGLQSLS